MIRAIRSATESSSSPGRLGRAEIEIGIEIEAVNQRLEGQMKSWTVGNHSDSNGPTSLEGGSHVAPGSRSNCC